MQATKEFLTDFPAFFGKAIAEISEDVREEGREEGVEQERKRLILYWYTSMGLSAKQIAKTMVLTVEYVQSVIDKNVI